MKRYDIAFQVALASGADFLIVASGGLTGRQLSAPKLDACPDGCPAEMVALVGHVTTAATVSHASASSGLRSTPTLDALNIL
jgi:hypothetical protein